MRLILTSVLLSLFIYSNCKSQPNYMLNQNFQVSQFYNKKPLDFGTCFFIIYNNNYYLVSNYHILSGISPLDVNKHSKEDIPSHLLVMLKNHYNKRIPIVFKLLNADGKRLFKVPKKDETKRIIDIAFLPVNKSDIPKELIINPLNISLLNESWVLNPNSSLYTCGFRGDADFALTNPIIDTVKSINDTTFNYKNKYIFAYSTIRLHGASGGLVYYKKNNVNIPIGVISQETVSEEAFYVLPELLNIKSHKPIYEFISMGEVKRQFYKLFNK